jgi:peptide subunit release factor RF-3
VKHSRLKGKELTLSSVQTISGNERSTLDEDCYPGDVIGINNPAGACARGLTRKHARAHVLSLRVFLVHASRWAG